MSDWTIHFGDCRTVLPTLAAGSVHTCVTSPPYYGLRDYGTATWEGGDDGCDHQGKPMATRANINRNCGTGNDLKNAEAREFYREQCGKCGARRIDQQIGLEKTPDQYVAEMVAVFREVRRVLRDDGTLWLNLGDSYAMSTKGAGGDGKQKTNAGSVHKDRSWQIPNGMKPKDLLGIPWRVAFALQADGWYLRQDIIWAKPNPMPESVRDRCTKAHEYIFLLAKSARYYYDSEAVKEANKTEPHARGGVHEPLGGPMDRNGHSQYDAARQDRVWGGNGRNRRSVWTVTPKPFKGAHFATFPPDLIEPCILAGCPVGGTVLDPFNGSGTTGMVAMKHGRKYVGIELNPDYIKMSEDRITKAINERPMFAAGLTKTGGGVA